MAYIGKTPVIGNFVKLDSITVVNGQAAYTMQNGGVNFTSYDNVNQFLVSLNGVLQAPTDSFTVSGSTLTFASNLSTGDVIDFVLVLGNSLDIGTPSDNTVTAAKIANSAVDLTSKVTGTLPVANGGTNLTSGFANGITEADHWRLTSDFTGTAVPIASNLERVDTQFSVIGSGMTESSGIFTFPSTGIYLVRFNHLYQFKDGNALSRHFQIGYTSNNSSYSTLAVSDRNGLDEGYDGRSVEALIDVTDTSNIKVRFEVNGASTNDRTRGNSSENQTCMTFIRLGDT